MSTNPSLKEQLQALSLVTDSKKPSHKKASKPANINEKQGSKQKPAWLERAQYGVELLKAHFPSCFKDMNEVKPLKKGIKQDLVKHLSGRNDIVVDDKACMVNSLSYYVNSMSYHRQMLEGANRLDLEGNPSGIVTKEEAAYSQECCQNKLKKKSIKPKASQTVQE